MNTEPLGVSLAVKPAGAIVVQGKSTVVIIHYMARTFLVDLQAYFTTVAPQIFRDEGSTTPAFFAFVPVHGLLHTIALRGLNVVRKFLRLGATLF